MLPQKCLRVYSVRRKHTQKNKRSVERFIFLYTKLSIVDFPKKLDAVRGV